MECSINKLHGMRERYSDKEFGLHMVFFIKKLDLLRKAKYLTACFCDLLALIQNVSFVMKVMQAEKGQFVLLQFEFCCFYVCLF